MSDLSDIDRFLTTPKPDPINRPSRQHPSGWEPGVDTARGVVVSPPSDSSEPPDWAEILEEFRLDPARWQVDSDSVNVRTWDAAVGAGEVRRFFYFKADVRPRQSSDSVDVDGLMKVIARHRFKRPVEVDTDVALVVCLADWQTGGDDPVAFTESVLAMKNRVVERIKTVQPQRLVVVGMGDMIEGCDGHYAMQTFQTGASGLNGRRDQMKLARRLLVDLVQEWARHVPEMVVSAVPGNHGENRKNGKAFTTFEDNDDIAVFEQTAEIFGANPETYGHVRFVLPDEDMCLTLDVYGTVVGFIHGHQARRGATPQQKLLNWWMRKGYADHPVGDAHVLVSGHFHTLQVAQDGTRTWFQCPAMAQSRWWEESGGARTATGTLTFTIGGDGWDNLKLC